MSAAPDAIKETQQKTRTLLLLLGVVVSLLIPLAAVVYMRASDPNAGSLGAGGAVFKRRAADASPRITPAASVLLQSPYMPARVPAARKTAAVPASSADSLRFLRGGGDYNEDPADGSQTALTPADDKLWDFRSSESPDGKQIVFCRAKTGEGPAIWVMDSDGKNAREITRGQDNLGADHPRWLPQSKR